MVRVRRHHDALSLGSFRSVARAAAFIAFGFLHLQRFILPRVEKVLTACASWVVKYEHAVRLLAEVSFRQAPDKAYRSGKCCCRAFLFAQA